MHFPEGALSGYAKHQITTDWSAYDWTGFEAGLLTVRETCCGLGLAAVVGGVARPDAEGRPFNSLYVIDAGGEIAHRYDKRFCSHTEVTDWYRAGRSPVVLDLGGVKIGLLLCIEVQFPELFMEYERLGVDCVFLSSYSDKAMFGIQAQGHAACNNYWVSLSVPAQLSHEQPACIIGPDGSVLASCARSKSAYVIQTIDPMAPQWDVPCQKARPWRRKARQGDIYR